ncbi:hypothetical protein ES703_66387 [subsurface metagenome]
MRVKITYVGAPFYLNGKTGFNVGVGWGEIHASAFISPGDDLNLTLSKVVKEAIQDKIDEERAEKFAQAVKKLVGTEIEVP